jgi:RimJ/RimL family protein N-acetyltransferase
MLPAELSVRVAEPRDAGAFARFVERHVAASGRDGVPVFAPMLSVRFEETRDAARQRWERGLDEAQWGRCFLLVEGDTIVGNAELRGGRIPAERHRATLGMGLLEPYTGRGLGQRLLEEALSWARRATSLDWIDLGVFEGNDRALRLYQRLGFELVGVRVDAFRLEDGRTIDDRLMTLRLVRSDGAEVVASRASPQRGDPP